MPITRVEMGKPCSYRWSDTSIIDIAKYLGIVMWRGIIGLPKMRMYIAKYLGIVMWMGTIGLPKMRMYWARNKRYSMPPFPQTFSPL